VVNEIAREFGAPQSRSDRLLAAQLFEPGEAMLSAAGAARLATIARIHARQKTGVEIHSVGQDRTRSAYDAWDLSAARLGAVARALAAGGIERKRLTIRGLDQGQKGSGSQVITVVYDTHD
jgi:flagellar motor protein MotB